MYRHILITTVLMMFALFAAPSMSAMDSLPVQSVLEEPAVEVAIESQKKKIEARALSSKRILATESNESADCFYESNKANAACDDAKSGQR